MKVNTTLLGELEIDSNKIITFPKGIPGFKNLHRFFILPIEGSEDIHWLHAVESPEVALLVIDPFKFFKNYSCDITDTDIEELELKSPNETLILTTITVPKDNPAETTANLVAPIVINTRLSQAKQVIMSGSPYKTKHQLFDNKSNNSDSKQKKTSNGGGK